MVLEKVEGKGLLVFGRVFFVLKDEVGFVVRGCRGVEGFEVVGVVGVVVGGGEWIFGFYLVDWVVFSYGGFGGVIFGEFILGFDYVYGEYDVFCWFCYYDLFGFWDNI